MQLDFTPAFAGWADIAHGALVTVEVTAAALVLSCLLGLLIGIGFFLLQRLIESGTVVFNLNPVLLAWLPTALLSVVTVALLARAR